RRDRAPALHPRPGAADEGRAARPRRVRRRGDAGRTSRGRRAWGRAIGPPRDRSADGLPHRRGRKHRGHRRTVPDRGHAPRPPGAREESAMPIRYVITTLKPGVRPDDYERWLREYDYRVARSLPSIVSYRTHRIEGPINGAEGAGWNYIERIEVRDKEQYAKDLASPAGQELIRQLYERYLERAKNVVFWSEAIEDWGSSPPMRSPS